MAAASLSGLEHPAGRLLEPLLEPHDLFVPEVPVAGAFLLRHFEDVEIPAGGQDVPGLLLGVAGRLADGQVLDRAVGAGIRQGQAQGRLDQRADIPGEHLLGVGDGQGRPAAEGDGDRPQRQDELVGDIDAERPDELVAGGPPLDDLPDARAVGAADDAVEVGHPAGPVFLGQDGPAEVPVDGAEDLVMELDVEAQLLEGDSSSIGHDLLSTSARSLFSLPGVTRLRPTGHEGKTIISRGKEGVKPLKV